MRFMVVMYCNSVNVSTLISKLCVCVRDVLKVVGSCEIKSCCTLDRELSPNHLHRGAKTPAPHSSLHGFPKMALWHGKISNGPVYFIFLFTSLPQSFRFNFGYISIVCSEFWHCLCFAKYCKTLHTTFSHIYCLCALNNNGSWLKIRNYLAD